MSINFDNLPKARPENLIPIGIHYAKVIKVSPPKISSKGNPNMDYVLELKDRNGKNLGRLYDNITETDSDYIKYKVSRLITACGLVLSGNVELKDLGKLINGKEFLVDIVHVEDGYTGKPVTKAKVALFQSDIFYPLKDAAKVFAEHPEARNPLADAPEAEEDFPVADAPINAADADDANIPTDADAPEETEY